MTRSFGSRSAGVGFTLIELMIALVIIAVLATIAFPTFQSQIRKSRRADAIASISQVQQAQERWRANNTSYGTLVNVGVPAATSGGYYTLSVANNTATGYQVLAQAGGAQASDTPCAFMQATLAGGNISIASGTDSSVGNLAAVNNRCWNR